MPRFSANQSNSELLQPVLDYCNDGLFKWILRGKVNVRCVIKKGAKFAANVHPITSNSYKITLNDSVFSSFRAIADSLSDKVIHEELCRISKEIFDSESQVDDIYKSLAYVATFFVIVHELSHVFRGHFDHLSHIRKSTHEIEEAKSEYSFDSSFFKLAELDADSNSLAILHQVSLELFALVSENYEQIKPSWRTNEECRDRHTTNQIIYYGCAIALSLIDINRTKSELHPMVYTRSLNLLDTLYQETLKTRGLLGLDNSKSILELPKTESIKEIHSELAYAYLCSLDFMVESCRMFDFDPSVKFGLEEEHIYQRLLADHYALSHSFEAKTLETEEGKELRALRQLRPEFNSRFPGSIMNSK